MPIQGGGIFSNVLISAFRVEEGHDKVHILELFSGYCVENRLRGQSRGKKHCQINYWNGQIIVFET